MHARSLTRSARRLSWLVVFGLVSVATPTPTRTPVGAVGGATGTPDAGNATPTLPSISTIDQTGSDPTGDGWRTILLAMAGVLAAALLLTPASVVVRKDNGSR